MTSFLLSALARMHQAGDLTTFSAAHPHCWIVWEPGIWKPPAKGAAETALAIRVPTPPPPTGEALALALSVRPGKPGQVTVGRAPTCDIEINDATLSQLHLLFMETTGRWTVRDAGSKNGTWLDGAQLRAGDPRSLADGTRIQAGQVCLTFYEPKGIFSRLRLRPNLTPARLQVST